MALRVFRPPDTVASHHIHDGTADSNTNGSYGAYFYNYPQYLLGIDTLTCARIVAGGA